MTFKPIHDSSLVLDYLEIYKQLHPKNSGKLRDFKFSSKRQIAKLAAYMYPNNSKSDDRTTVIFASEAQYNGFYWDLEMVRFVSRDSAPNTISATQAATFMESVTDLHLVNSRLKTPDYIKVEDPHYGTLDSIDSGYRVAKIVIKDVEHSIEIFTEKPDKFLILPPLAVKFRINAELDEYIEHKNEFGNLIPAFRLYDEGHCYVFDSGLNLRKIIERIF